MGNIMTVKTDNVQLGTNAVTLSKNIVLAADAVTGDLVINKGTHDGVLTEMYRFPNGGGLRDSVSVKDFGAVGDGVTDDTVATQAALATGKNVYVPEGVYIISDMLQLQRGQQLTGAGLDVWDFVSHGIQFSMGKGTTLLFKGTPSTFATVEATTEMNTTGGVVANPDATSAGDATYRLLDFTNKDAVGTSKATLKQLKVAVLLEEASGAAVRSLRIQLNYNGIDGYNDESLTGLGDNWDIGLLVKNSSQVLIEHVQAVGYWRMAGCVQANAKLGNTALAEGVYNRYLECYFQGYKGMAFRAPDVFPITALTETTIEIPWTPSNPVDVLGLFWISSSVYYNPTAAVKVGDKLVLSVPSTTGRSVGDELRINIPNVGVAGTVVQNCVITGLFHRSRLLPHSTELGFASPGAAIEISGFPMRDVDFINTHFFDSDVLLHAHNVEDLGFVGCFTEAYGYRIAPGDSFGPAGGRMIVSGDIGNGLASYNVNGVQKVTFDASTEFAATTDIWPVARNAALTRFSNAVGLYRPIRHLNLAEGVGTGSTPLLSTAYNAPTTLAFTGTTAPALRVIDKDYATQFYLNGDTNYIVGTVFSASNNRSNDTSKAIRYTVPAYNTAQLEVLAMFATGEAALNRITIGGGSSLAQAATEIRFSTAAAVNTVAGTERLRIDSAGVVTPGGDNSQTLGSASRRWSVVYAGTGTINTSDEREKQQVRELSGAEKRVALALKGQIRAFKFNDAVAAKGDAARIHFGVMAQTVKAAFEDEGLAAEAYSVLCHDTWGELPEIKDEQGGITQEFQPAGDRYGVRYEELLAFIISTL